MVEVSNKTRSKLNIALIKKIARVFLKYFNKRGYSVSIVIVGNSKIRALNKKYRQTDRVTDVLAFGENDDPGPQVEISFLGEIIINYQQIKGQAKRYGNTVKDELVFILVHGLLHLLGYEDGSRKGREEMERLGREFIKKTLSTKS